MQGRRDPGRVIKERRRIHALLAQPVDVGMTFRPIIARVVAPVKDAVAVIPARLDPTGRAGQMQLAGQATVVAGVGQELRHQRRGIGPDVIAVHAGADAAGVHARQEAGAAGRADRILTVGVGKGNACADQPVDVGRVGPVIAERMDGVVALLIGANPQDIGSCVGGHRPAWVPSRLRAEVQDAYGQALG